MTRFFFHLHDDLISRDEEGTLLPDVAAARQFAAINARDIACAEVKKGHLGLSHRIEIADAQGTVIDRIKFRDVIKVQP